MLPWAQIGKQKIQRYWWVLGVSLGATLLVGCQMITPPRELAPNGAILKRAIVQQWQNLQREVADQVQLPQPQIAIDRIRVDLLEPQFIGALPSYHFHGHYRLTLTFSSDRKEKREEEFDLYLQRQMEGKTWRLLRQIGDRWHSYRLGDF